MLRIVPYPHPALRYESRPVTRIDDAFRTAVRQMFGLMYEARGIGLAANQVGLPFRFFILNLSADPEQPDKEQVFINPEVVKRHASVEEEEGCLSFPGLYTKVRRARRVKVRAFDLEGNPVEVEADDLFGRALQHETDHLAGRLFIDLLSPLNRVSTANRLKDFEAQYLRAQAEGLFQDDATIVRELDALASDEARLADHLARLAEAHATVEGRDGPDVVGPGPAHSAGTSDRHSRD